MVRERSGVLGRPDGEAVLGRSAVGVFRRLHAGRDARRPDVKGDARLDEGALTAAVLVGMARSKGVDMPIAEAVNAVLEGRCGIDEAGAGLTSRPLKAAH